MYNGIDHSGVILLKRMHAVDAQLDLLQRDPIVMRTFLSISIECLNRRKDLILSIAITNASVDSTVVRDDYLPRGLVCKGNIYLAESINLHRFFVSHSNPNVISISKASSKDPLKQLHIDTMYYYTVPYDDLQVALSPIVSTLANLSTNSPNRLLDSLESFVGLEHLLPIVLVANWIGTDHDYYENSIFHLYIQANKIIYDIPDRKSLREQSLGTERKIFSSLMAALIIFLYLSFIICLIYNKVALIGAIIYALAILLCKILLFINLIL
ncbi:hypothetical protein NEOKW01_1867 [Nematocida sp. AWRm80]|nr:hypothetical protein NEOKW01_1867 [Nematocida sp. AWRm80]